MCACERSPVRVEECQARRDGGKGEAVAEACGQKHAQVAGPDGCHPTRQEHRNGVVEGEERQQQLLRRRREES